MQDIAKLPAYRPERAEAMLRMRLARKSTREIGEHFGVSAGRVSQIMGAMGCPRFRLPQPSRGVIHSAERIAHLVALYDCGLTIPEVAYHEGLSLGTVHTALNRSPAYSPRLGLNAHRDTSDFEVPAWVSAGLIPRFVRLAAYYGEEVAAGCIRNAKRLGITS